MPSTSRVKYLTDSAVKRLRRSPRDCPACGYPASDPVSSKYVVTELRRCRSCRLLVRFPTISSSQDQKYYQEDYAEGFTTTMPKSQELRDLFATEFRGSAKDFSEYVQVLQTLRPNGRVLDFGCSWGYGSWQFSQSGFDVEAYDISAPRREFARTQLGVSVLDHLPDSEGRYDIFFSAHVLEHVPSPVGLMRQAIGTLVEEGYFVAFTPNASEVRRRIDGRAWNQLWGRDHPCLPDEVFYLTNSLGRDFYIASRPYDLNEIAEWARGEGPGCRIGGLEGDEMVYITRKSTTF